MSLVLRSTQSPSDGQLGHESGRYTEDERGHLADSQQVPKHKLKPQNLRSADDPYDDSKQKKETKKEVVDPWAAMFGTVT